MITGSINLSPGESQTNLKLLAIAGSPRRGCNTDRLLNEAIAGAASKGVLVKQVVLSDLEISCCQHCDGCIQLGGRCVIEDDMQDIHHDIRSFDRFILSSPVFFMGISAQAKAMVDRCQALWVLKYLLKQPVSYKPGAVRKGAFISVGATDYKTLFTGSLATVRSWFKTLDIDFAGELLVPAINECNAISSHPTALKEAYSLGETLAIQH